MSSPRRLDTASYDLHSSCKDHRPNLEEGLEAVPHVQWLQSLRTQAQQP